MQSEDMILYIKQFIELEDGVAIKLGEFLSQILDTSAVDDELKVEIRRDLDILCKDGEKHMRLVKEIENYVERSDQDEF